MKRMIFTVVLLILFPNLSQATDTLMVRQDIGKNAIFYWFHDEKDWGSNFLYVNGDNPIIVAGLTPRLQFQAGIVGVKIINYFNIKSDLFKTQWPVKFLGADNFIFFSFRNFILLSRITPDFNLVKRETQYSGRDYLGFKLNERWQIQVQTEWVYSENKFSQTFGLGWCHNLTKSIGLDGYLGVGSKLPYKKVGWFAIRLIME